MTTEQNPTQLSPLRLPATTDISPLVALAAEGLNESQLRHALAQLPFNIAYDYLRTEAFRLADSGEAAEAISRIEAFDTMATRRGLEEGPLLDIHAAIMQILTAVRLTTGDIDGAMTDAATALTLLSQSPKRRDEPFLAVLATLLHDIAIIHSARGEYRQAERDIEKSLKLFSRLVNHWPERYTAPHMLAMSASTGICRSRDRQAAMLREHAAATEEYMARLRKGDRSAADALIDSLGNEGITLARMGKQREAVQYLTRALRLLTEAEPEFTPRQLQLSVELGEALLTVKATREKGVHLLNTMLHKATRLHDDTTYRRIASSLRDAGSGNRDILGFWHKMFPR